VPTTHRHPIFARVYPHISGGPSEAEHRQILLLGLAGRVIEVGAGHGLNFPLYPPEVTHVLAIEPEPYLRKLARAAAGDARVSIEVKAGEAEELPAQDGEFDAAVASLVLCSVRDQATALQEIMRVLRPGGELRFYEHVISNRPASARLMRLLDATIYPPIAGGCHCARDTGTAIRQAGFQVGSEQRTAFKRGACSPSVPHILGTARRP
jgi:ubiquinone/menaquinone biosynthesis C-methylase UbiE